MMDGVPRYDTVIVVENRNAKVHVGVRKLVKMELLVTTTKRVQETTMETGLMEGRATKSPTWR